MAPVTQQQAHNLPTPRASGSGTSTNLKRSRSNSSTPTTSFSYPAQTDQEAGARRGGKRRLVYVYSDGGEEEAQKGLEGEVDDDVGDDY
jgi:hypothetical protein